MQALSITEFEKYCRSLRPTYYIYDSMNQEGYYPGNPFRAIMRYKIMLTYLSPDSICFQNDNSSLRLEHVKYIILDLKRCSVGTIFTIVCGDKNSTENDTKYTMIAD